MLEQQENISPSGHLAHGYSDQNASSRHLVWPTDELWKGNDATLSFICHCLLTDELCEGETVYWADPELNALSMMDSDAAKGVPERFKKAFNDLWIM